MNRARLSVLQARKTVRSALWHNDCGVEAGGRKVLWTIFVILIVLWLLGLVTSYTLGGFIHVLLVIAVVILIINLIQGRRSV